MAGIPDGWKAYSLINPSDEYTFYAPNHELASIAAWLLSGAFGAEPLEAAPDDPPCYGVALFGGIPKAFTDKVGDAGEYVAAHRAEIADVLDTFIVGTQSRNDREALDELRKRMTDAEWKTFYGKRDDEQRSSLNRIGTAAHELAAKLRKTAKKKTAKVA